MPVQKARLASQRGDSLRFTVVSINKHWNSDSKLVAVSVFCECDHTNHRVYPSSHKAHRVSLEWTGDGDLRCKLYTDVSIKIIISLINKLILSNVRTAACFIQKQQAS